MIQQPITIINKLGLHARAAAKLVACSSRFESNIQLKKGEPQKNEQIANGKSIMGVMMLAASQHTELVLHIDGKDEQEALDALVELINDKFGEAA
jgi:phosphocarrier protein